MKKPTVITSEEFHNLEFDVHSVQEEYGLVPVRYTLPGFKGICDLHFQNGTIPEVGVNGVTLEALLDICHHRLQAFQLTRFASTYNSEAMDHIKKAIDALNRRTKDRQSRGVEGTLEE